MKSIVVYRSKSGNTKGIAEIIAEKIDAKALPVNLISKKGRGTKEEQENEKQLFADALESSKNADLALIGTPVSFQQAHPQITRFAKQVEAKNVALFCTYINKPGTTLDDLQAICKERGIGVAATVDFGGLNSGQFAKLDKGARDRYLTQIEEFVRKCTDRL